MPTGSLWVKARETAIDHIGATIGSVITTAAVAGAVAAWAALKAWVVVDVPAGLVVGSTVECRDLKGGWSSFDAAGGRFIVGAGGHPLNPGVTKVYAAFTTEGAAPGAGQEKSTGGEEAHSLIEPELARHSHRVYRHAGGETRVGNPGDWVPGAGSSDNYTFVKDNWQTGVTGEGKAFAILPPYIALYYCKKI